MLFNPNTTCVIIKVKEYNAYGEPIREERITEPCAVIDASWATKKSSVRADSSASRGNALETIADFWLLMLPTTVAAQDDIIEVYGRRVKVKELRPRFSLYGDQDHTEALCSIWNGETE